tara:strand:+ start:521 stop:1069 length:549 start_codon:yes stop_codon:yes gene_type:complete
MGSELNNLGISASGLTNTYMENRDNEFLFTKHYNDYNTMGNGGIDNVTHDILKGIIELNDLSRFFFSRKNIDHLQRLIIREVARLSKGKYNIGPQNEYQLLIVMRSIYLQYSQNRPDETEQQIIALNRQLIYEVVPRVMSGIENYLSYMRDQGSNPVPHLGRPENVNITGTKTTNSYDSLFI